MKKIVVLIFSILLILLPTLALAQATSPIRFNVPNPTGFGNIELVIERLLQVAFAIAALVAIIFIITGGYRYVTSQGNPEAVEAAKATIVNSVIGLIVVLIAALIVNYILRALGAQGLFTIGNPTNTNIFNGGGGGGTLPNI